MSGNNLHPLSADELLLDAKSPTDSLIEILGTRLAIELNQAIGRAITKKLGHDRWTLEELRGRCHTDQYQKTGLEVFCLDGEPLVEVYPIEVQHVGTQLTATRSIREMV